ncbi:MAG: diguanylate cyclase [Planctomycetaceae bacterium]|nr:diguanylate cyclase [Planctomycetaceae bacterium]
MLRKLLLVDDDDDCRRLTHRLLTRAGYDVLEATDGINGYERVLTDAPEMIITDWDMPRLNGLDLIRRIRAAKLSWYPYIVLVTASENAELGLDSGADDFLSKPIREEQLMPRVRAGERIVTLQSRLNEQNQALNRANQRLEQLATTDSLSGLLNRRAFFEAAEREWRRSQRYGIPLCCLLLDIDHFKQVNDTYGHAAGDAAIVSLAQLLKSRLRTTDLVCRYGGEEFCIWLVSTSLADAEQVAETLRREASCLVVPELGTDPRLSVSIGIAARAADMPSERTLIDQADQALLLAKQLGRDRVASYARGQEHASRVPGPDRGAAGQPSGGTPFEPSVGGLVRACRTALSLRDPPLGRQIDRRLELCRELGGIVGLDAEQQCRLELAARLMDVGWLTMNETRPTDGSVETRSGAARRRRAESATLEILQAAGADPQLLELLRLRDQWYDGSRGEPHGQAIPAAARLLSLIASFIELRDSAEDSPLGTSSATEAAIDSLRMRAGQQFDPAFVARLAGLFAAGSSLTDSSLVPAFH